MFIAIVTISTYNYMSIRYVEPIEKYHTIIADSEKMACDKIIAYYEGLSDQYSTSYRIDSIEFFTPIP